MINSGLVAETRLVYQKDRVVAISEEPFIKHDTSVLAPEPPGQEPTPESSHNSGEDPSSESP